MNNSFFCEHCQKSFQAQGKREEWYDAVFGNSWKLVAECPQCRSSSNELKDKLTGSSSSDSSEMAPSSCAAGACPYIN